MNIIIPFEIAMSEDDEVKKYVTETKIGYLTMKEKMDYITELTYQRVCENFIDRQEEDLIDFLEENDIFYKTALKQTIWTKEYRDYTFLEMRNLPNEDIINIYNDICGDTDTLSKIEDCKVSKECCETILKCFEKITNSTKELD